MDGTKLFLEISSILDLIFPKQLHPFQEPKSSTTAVRKTSKPNASAPYGYPGQKNDTFLFSWFLIA